MAMQLMLKLGGYPLKKIPSSHLKAGRFYTSDGVGLGVVIRSIELYDLVKKAFWFVLRLRRYD